MTKAIAANKVLIVATNDVDQKALKKLRSQDFAYVKIQGICGHTESFWVHVIKRTGDEVEGMVTADLNHTNALHINFCDIIKFDTRYIRYVMPSTATAADFAAFGEMLDAQQRKGKLH